MVRFTFFNSQNDQFSNLDRYGWVTIYYRTLPRAIAYFIQSYSETDVLLSSEPTNNKVQRRFGSRTILREGNAS